MAIQRQYSTSAKNPGKLTLVMINMANNRYQQHGTRPISAARWRLMRAVLCVVSGLALHGASQADDFQGQESLRELSKTFLEQRLTERGENEFEVSVDRLDSRLRLNACGEEPRAFLPSGSRLIGKLTVGIRCESPKPWTLYIPAEIKIFSQVATAALPLKRGTEISQQDLAMVRMEISTLHTGYFTDAKHVIGKVVETTMRQGDVFSPRRLKAPVIVHHGEEVTILATVGSLQVRSKGKALKNAAKGEKVSVRNTRSKRVVEAVAIEPGVVQVNM